MIKKTCLAAFLSLVLLVFIPQSFAETNEVRHIKESFNSISNDFFSTAEVMYEEFANIFYITKKVDDNLTYYIILHMEGIITPLITGVWVRTELELDNDAVEIYSEGIILYSDGFNYSLEHNILYRNENCRTEKLEPVKIWDYVIEYCFKNIKEE